MIWRIAVLEGVVPAPELPPRFSPPWRVLIFAVNQSELLPRSTRSHCNRFNVLVVPFHFLSQSRAFFFAGIRRRFDRAVLARGHEVAVFGTPCLPREAFMPVIVGVLGYPAGASLAQLIRRRSRGDPRLNRPVDVKYFLQFA